jgi:hypothetical protein
MALQTVTLQLPESMYQSARRTAKAVNQPIGEVLVTALKSTLPPLEGLAPEIITELTALEFLPDKQLWTMARSKLPQPQRRKLSHLLRKNQAGTLTEREERALDELIAESERLMLRKARAFVLLKWRGYAPAAGLARENGK